uniref:Uncharacterized protein n=1 Tax=Medicago truncatula TaxID=3880 RepID=A2Q522_MEDTR|nr:hypothetical protein MtrDRAFT_AC158497g49v2 [Medicago truncatula]
MWLSSAQSFKENSNWMAPKQSCSGPPLFHRPSKVYTSGTRTRRKVHTNEEGCETRWDLMEKTRVVFAIGVVMDLLL